MENILELKSVDVSYGAIRAMESLSLSVPPGDTVWLIGANGAGKSSTLRAISGLEPFKGSVLFKGAPTAGVPVHHLVRRGMVHCPEGRGVLAGLSVGENLDLGAYTRKDMAGGRKDRDSASTLF